MPVSYINSTSGSQSSALGSGTLTLTLSAAPTTGQWLFVAITTNDHNTMAPQVPIKCGTVTLSTLDNGFTVVPASRVPYVVGSPFQSGMSTSITIPWTNGSGAGRGIYACAIVIGGLATTPTSAFAHLKSYNANGLFDGTSGSYDIGASNSNGNDGAFFNMLAFTNSAGIYTSYDSQKQPFVLATWQTGATTAPSTLNGAATIASGVITTSGQSSGTVVLASAATYGTTGTAYLLTPDGVLPFTWTGKSGNNLTGCSISGGSASGFYNYSLATGTGASINHPVLIQTSSNTAAQPINGWQMGVNATTGIGVNIATAGVSGVQAAGQLTLSFGQAGGLSTTPAYLITEAVTAAGAVLLTAVPSTRTMTRSSKATQVLTNLASKTINRVRQAIATQVLPNLVTKTRNLVRTAKAAHIRIASEVKRAYYLVVSAALGVLADYDIKTVNRVRQAIASQVLPDLASKTINRVRQVIATNVRLARESRQVFYQVVSAAMGVLADYDLKTVNRVRQAIVTMSRASRASKTTNRVRQAVATMSRASRASKVLTLTKRASSALVGASQGIKTATFNRTAKATAVNSVVVTRAIVRNRTAVATATYAISSSKSRTAIRRAIATAVAYARVTPVIKRFVTHPGTVSAAVKTASVSSSVKTATVSASVTTATVRSAVKTATVSADVKTASVRSSVKPLV